MSRSALCVFALGLSVSLAAACGDDDDDGFGTAGTGGRAGAGGSAGRGGSSGAAGSGGDAGFAGDANGGQGGSSGSGGSGGTGGSGGSSGSGNGGSSQEPPDGGPDATADGGDVVSPTDAGVEPIACVDDLDDALEAASSSNLNQNVIIARVVFDGPNAIITFKAVNGSFDFAPPLQLCTGSEPDDCDDRVQTLTGSGTGDAGVEGDLLEGETIEFTTPLGPIVTAASGELALVNGLPNQEPDEPIIRAYIKWGNYESLPPSTGNNDDLETEAAEEGGPNQGVWFAGDSIDTDGQSTIYALADVVDENGFAACTPEP